MIFFVIYCLFVVKVRVMDVDTGVYVPIKDKHQTYSYKGMGYGLKHVNFFINVGILINPVIPYLKGIHCHSQPCLNTTMWLYHTWFGNKCDMYANDDIWDGNLHGLRCESFHKIIILDIGSSSFMTLSISFIWRHNNT